MRKRWWLVSALVLVALVVTACKGPAGPAGPPGPGLAPMTRELKVWMEEFEVIGEEPLEKLGIPEHTLVGEFHYWMPNTLVVFKGDKVKLTVTNPRGAVHSLVLVDFAVDTGPLAPRGGSKTVEFTADKVGTFRFACGIPHDPKKTPHDCDPDHKRMIGHLIVLDR